MSADSNIDLTTANARALAYGRLAQCFSYPDAGRETLLSTADYTEAFDPAASAVACSLREYYYNKDIHATSLNEELLRFYHFFGLQRSDNAPMPDHLAVELEFLQFLNLHEANESRSEEELSSLQRAQRDFLQRHTSILVRGVESSLRVENPACKELVALVVAVVNADMARLLKKIGLADEAAA